LKSVQGADDQRRTNAIIVVGPQPGGIPALRMAVITYEKEQDRQGPAHREWIEFRSETLPGDC
jgi:hypothetical protein